MDSYAIYRMVPFSMTLSEPKPSSKLWLVQRNFRKVEMIAIVSTAGATGC